MRIYRLKNVIQNYAWGSTTAIARLTGQPVPSAEPQAELWMGTHPKGPSMALVDDQATPLQELIDQRPVEMLGAYTADRFGPALPYLFKILAAASPLSIQAHPDKAQAVDGFARENSAGKPLDAPDRNYRDDNHKPEIIAALTPFWGLNGFRRPERAARLLEPVCPELLQDAHRALRMAGEGGLRSFFEAMMILDGAEKAAACREIVAKAGAIKNKDSVYTWICRLADAYPDDLGILSPALLNLVCLEPGQAMFLPAGQLHAYLDGVGIELMANSDNVLRGGLTPKHVDLQALLGVIRFQSTRVEMIAPEPLIPSESVFTCPAAEFVLSIIETRPERDYQAPSMRSVEILLCTRGQGTLTDRSCGERLAISRGDSLLIPAAVDTYSIGGDLTLYKAGVPLKTAQ
jgi:mannose-6-phosphate isomerase